MPLVNRIGQASTVYLEAIVSIAALLTTALVPCPLLARAKAPPSCDSWLSTTAKGADKRSERQWRDWTTWTLADACSAIPQELREGAASARGVKDPLRRAQILANAAAANLGPTCAVPDPLDDARKLAAACPLPPNLRFKADESLLMDMRAVDYALLNAILRALLGANQYTPEAERVVLNFTLSAQILGEDFRTKNRKR